MQCLVLRPELVNAHLSFVLRLVEFSKELVNTLNEQLAEVRLEQAHNAKKDAS